MCIVPLYYMCHLMLLYKTNKPNLYLDICYQIKPIQAYYTGRFILQIK